MIGLELTQKYKRELVNVEYVDSITNIEEVDEKDESKLAKLILSRKLSHWNYEKECRVLTSDAFVKIEIKEILLGCKITLDDEEFVKSLTEKLLPSVKVRKLDRGKLN